MLIAAAQSLKYLSKNQEVLKSFTIAGPMVLLVLGLLTAVFLQIGVNYANDYFDNQKEIFSKVRPVIDVKVAKRRMIFSLTMGAICGIILVLSSPLDWTGRIIMLIIGVLCICAAYFYSGGKIDYAAKGWGDLVSGIFFGPVSVCGLFFIATNGGLLNSSWWYIILLKSLAIGLVVSGMMMLDNIRDIETDPQKGKHTLQSRIGLQKSIRLYSAVIIAAFCIAVLIAVITGAFYLICFGLELFTLVTMVYQAQNLKEMNIAKAFSFNVIIGIALSLLMIF